MVKASVVPGMCQEDNVLPPFAVINLTMKVNGFLMVRKFNFNSLYSLMFNWIGFHGDGFGFFLSLKVRLYDV